jgi:titin
VKILGGAMMNTVGGTAAAARNTISGNGTGVVISAGTTATNVVEGNAIGTNAARSVAVANGTGLLLGGGTTGNTIGGASAGARNLISGNTNDGIDINGADQNQVQGNFIGTNAAGTAALANGSRGVAIIGSSSSNTIGGLTSTARNVISGNGFVGVDVFGSCRSTSASNNVIEGNRIGTNAAGTAAVGNFQWGVRLDNCSTATRVGGTTSGARNVISGQAGTGVLSESSDGNLVEGNYIGTDAVGAAPISNGFGIQLQKANNNTIGGATAAARNVISGNGSEAIRTNSQCNGNVIEGNYIGTDASGLGSVANGTGVNFYGVDSNNIIGGTTAGARNVISGNAGDAVGLFNPGTTANTVEGNYIGTDKTGAAPLPNAGAGVLILTGATNDTIGGTTPAAANIIANGTNGVFVDGSATLGNSILGNSIFANSGLGISLTSGGNNNEPAPTITSVMTGGGNTKISGAVIAGTHRIEVFQNPTCSDPEGKTFLGAVTASTTSWSLTVPAVSSPALTATSTDASTGNTSQFSRCAMNP